MIPDLGTGALLMWTAITFFAALSVFALVSLCREAVRFDPERLLDEPLSAASVDWAVRQ